MALCCCGHHEYTHDPECMGVDEDFDRCKCREFERLFTLMKSDDSLRQIDYRLRRSVINVELPAPDGED